MTWKLSLEQAIDKYDLADHVAALDTVGMTVVPLLRTGFTAATVEHAKQRLLQTVRERTGIDFDEQRGPLQPVDQSRAKSKGYFYVTRMLEVDPVFVDLQTNPVLNTLHRFILGDDFRLGTSSGFLKWADPDVSKGPTHGMHIDSPLAKPAGFGYDANVNWLLTDYTIEAGPICYVPGSHKWGEFPTPDRITPEVLGMVRGVEGEAGSLAVFHASLWHGTLPRTAPGMRLSTHSQRRIPVLLPPGDFRSVSDELIAASADPDVMRMLCWKNDVKGLVLGGADFDRQRGIPRAVTMADA